MSARAALALLAACVLFPASSAAAADPAPSGQVTRAVHFTLAPRWLDPAEGPRVEEPALALIPFHPYSAPYEDVRLKP